MEHPAIYDRMNAALTHFKRPLLTEDQMDQLEAWRKIPLTPCEMLFEYGSSFPQCHASTVLPLEDGRILTAYFAGSHEKADDVGIWLSVREKGVWAAPRRIAKVAPVAHWNPVLYRSAEGVTLLFKVGAEISHWVSWTMHSADGGDTWSLPQPLNADNPAGGPVRNKPLLLADGRLLAPNSDESAMAWLPRVDVSVDGGRTFRKLADIPLNRTDASRADYLPGAGAIQPTLWESAPGQVHALLRTTGGFIYRSDSVDGGATWCTAYPLEVANNNSGIDLTQVNGVLYLVMNPLKGDKAPRTPIVVMRSEDQGKTFTLWRVLANQLMDEVWEKVSEFSYPAIVAAGDTLHITFTHQRKSVAYCAIKAE